MPTYSSFAIVGAGEVGRPLVQALLDQKVSVVVLTRPNSTSSIKLPAGAKSVTVDLKDKAALEAVFKENNIEVVISTVGQPGLPDQPTLADAAKAAGVKLFVPSEFGLPTLGGVAGELGEKEIFGRYLKTIGLPSLRIFTGGFIHFIPWLTGLHAGDKKFKIKGSGKVKMSFTDLGDIVGFTAYVLTTLPRDQLENAVFRIEGQNLSLLEVAALFGDKVQVEHVDKFSLGLLNYLHDKLENGQASTRYDAVSGKDLVGKDANQNYLWEGHQWKKVADVLDITVVSGN